MTATSPAQRAQLIQQGRDKIAASGGRLGGRAPYGWAPVPSAALVEVPEEQHVIWLIGHLTRSGWSQDRIAAALTDMSVPGPSGGAWPKQAVRRVLLRSGVPTRPANGAGRAATPPGEQLQIGRAATG